MVTRAPRKIAEMMTTVGSTMASFTFAWAITQQYCHYELCGFLEKCGHRLVSFFYPYIRVSIHEFTGTRFKHSKVYAAVDAYLSANSSQSAKRLKAEMGKVSKKLVLSIVEYDKEQAEEAIYSRSKTQMVKPQAYYVEPYTFEHPVKFEATAMETEAAGDHGGSFDVQPEKKKTEKLTEDKNEQGKKEAYLKEPKEESTSRVTLSGSLNFIDGLWSASGGKRIIAFTTNYVEKLDPALIRRGRMDKHIELSYCRFEGFKVLAKNYLQVEAHPLFELIEQLMEETKITPAEVAETIIPSRQEKVQRNVFLA
ncbi:P-loop containing nucleoside triphosphate hydrolases superfamily protein [Actinidia rufa]|uniref:P-loop containing nucleoside triphosphate hydrolases superfamily protein n=1 Tax=Actinidia rufa TaxID=165716 RepID=A0A7J0H3C4_9ERIC|nr:P-loop containing nucleoside triphosphate hydrolases superfamily protein [Actinidia rufa]